MCYSGRMKRLLFLLLLAVQMGAGCRSVSITFEDPSLPPGDILGCICWRAVYRGTELQPCRFMTAQCPDACTHGGVVAVFTREEALFQAGTTPFDGGEVRLRLRLRKGALAPETSQALCAAVERLKPGQRVVLGAVRLYRKDPVTGSRWPETVITHLTE